MVRVKERWGKFVEWAKPFVKPVGILWAGIMLGMLAILRANFSYMDDLARTVEGYKGWGNFSRYLSNFLAMVVNGNTTVTDISPWPQILAALIMAVAGVMLLYIIYGRKRFRWWELMTVAILALNPYFLECLSYKFDAPYIAVSVLAMVLPMLAMRKETKWYILAVMSGTLVTCMTYQASLGILPMLVILVAMERWSQGENGKEVWGLVWKAVVGYGLGLVIFRVFLMRQVDAYVTTSLPAIGELLPTVLRNLREYYELIGQDLTKIWILLMAVLGLGFIGISVMRSERKKYLAGIVAVLGVGLMGAGCFGIYPLMEQPLYEPRAMFGVMVMVAMLGVVVVKEGKWQKKWQKVGWGSLVVVVVALSYEFGIFGLTYGNALALQGEYTDFRIQETIGALEDVMQENETEEDVTVKVAGTIGLAPALEGVAARYPILERLVPVEFESGYWGEYKLFRYYGLRRLQGDPYEIPKVEDYEVVKEGRYQNIRRKDKEFLIELKKV